MRDNQVRIRDNQDEKVIGGLVPLGGWSPISPKPDEPEGKRV
jgi:hypothetical protein